MANSKDINTELLRRIHELQLLDLNMFSYTEFNNHDTETDIDPDNNFFSSANINCKYYTNAQYNTNLITKGKLSIIHFNSRSMYSNYSEIRDYLVIYSSF